MLPLRRILIDYDLALLRIIAGLWGVDLAAGEARAAVEELVPLLLQAETVAEMVEALAPEARTALDHLARAGGALPAAQCTRQLGEIRPMGPARRDREQPWLTPASPLEALWYRGLIGRAFGEGRPSPQEYFFIPSDLLPLLPPPAELPLAAPGRPAPEPEEFQAAGSAIVDDVCTALAYWQNTAHDSRLRRSLALAPFLITPESQEMLLPLAERLGLLHGAPPRPNPAQARPYLEAPRAHQHQRLAEAWQTDAGWNDLAHVPGLDLGQRQDGERALPNDPLAARQAVLTLLKGVPAGEWWSLPSFVQAVQDSTPDFQRPAGDYDSWYIRDAATGETLRGFENWDRVEGALIRWLIGGPLHWLGLVDLSPGDDAAGPDEVGETAFRLTWAGRALLQGEAWPADPPEPQLRIESDGTLVVPALVKPYDRFTAARFADWERLEVERPEGPVYRYRVSAGSLASAHAQEVAVRHVLAFLRKAAANPIPPRLAEALLRWEREGTEAVVGEATVLQVKSAEVLERLRLSPKIRPLLGKALGPEAVEVRRQDVGRLRAALIEAGVLAEVQQRD